LFGLKQDLAWALAGRLSRWQLEKLVVDAVDHGKTITRLDLLPRNTPDFVG